MAAGYVALATAAINAYASLKTAATNKYNLVKGGELASIQFEEQKTLDVYNMAAEQRQNQFIIIAITLIAVALIVAMVINKH